MRLDRSIWQGCIATKCATKGLPREDTGEFVCTVHVGKCDPALIADHTIKASALVTARQMEAAYAGGPQANVLQRQMVVRAARDEKRAWMRIRDQVIKTFGQAAEPVKGA